MHANALLLLNFLVNQGIVEISAEDYHKFSELYALPELQVTNVTMFDATLPSIFTSDNKKERLEQIQAEFDKIIRNIRVVDTKKLIRLIGDDVVDRGVTDELVLKMFDRLDQQGANFEILLSNHGVEFVEACERFKEKGELIAPRLLIQHAGSFYSLKKSIQAGVITNEAILDLYHRVYKKHLKLISYSLDAVNNEQLGMFKNYVGDFHVYVTDGKQAASALQVDASSNKDKDDIPEDHQVLRFTSDQVEMLMQPTLSQRRDESKVRLSSSRDTLFRQPQRTIEFPESYSDIWDNGYGISKIGKIRELLKDYTKEDTIFGSLIGRIFTGHWNRHHVDEVSRIANTRYDNVNVLIEDRRSIRRAPGGSLDRRIQFIESQISTPLREMSDLTV